MSKKPIDISTLLAWTYREEMPKLDQERLADDEWSPISASSSTWASIERLAVLGVRVDTSGPAPDDRPLIYPAPDALIVNHAVLGLADWDVSVPNDWDALGDCTGLTDAERAAAHEDGRAIAALKADRLAALVMRRACTGGVPTWRDHGPIYRRFVCGSRGKPAWFRLVDRALPGEPSQIVEEDGRNPKTRRPYPDAYRKQYLDPAPSLLIAERIEYQAWALALHGLVETLTGRLSAFALAPCRVDLWPWEADATQRRPRVLAMVKSTGAGNVGHKAA